MRIVVLVSLLLIFIISAQAFPSDLPPLKRIHDMGGGIVLKFHVRFLPGEGPGVAFTFWEEGDNSPKWVITRTSWSPLGPRGMSVKEIWEVFFGASRIARKEIDISYGERKYLPVWLPDERPGVGDLNAWLAERGAKLILICHLFWGEGRGRTGLPKIVQQWVRYYLYPLEFLFRKVLEAEGGCGGPPEPFPQLPPSRS